MANFEDELLQTFGGGVRTNPTGLTIIFIADTHGDLRFHKERLDNLPRYDLCVLLGDHSDQELCIIKEKIDNRRLFGVLGNHDMRDQYIKAGIKDLTSARLTVGGVRIGGLGGSFKYKQSPHYALLTHDESMELAKKFDDKTIDILVSHDKPYTVGTGDDTHDGLKGITYAIYKNHLPLHFHGHLHKPATATLKNGCRSRCIYGIEVVTL